MLNQPQALRFARDLLARMTLAEKVGQMTQVDLKALSGLDEIDQFALGSMLSGGDSDPSDISPNGWRRTIAELQERAGRSRLGIPLLYGIDAVHGFAKAEGATVFPHNIGLGASGDAGLVERSARATAEDAAATGIRWIFAPCVAVAQNPSWGRTYESFGASADLVSRLGAAAVQGIQGPVLSPGSPALACAKHFVADGGTFAGVDQGDAQVDARTLSEIHLAPYRAAIAAGVGSIMASYSAVNGIKMHAHRELITKTLKEDLGFAGFVVSDWAGIDQVDPDYKKAIGIAINAGIDMAMLPFGPGVRNNYREFIAGLIELVEAGVVPISRVDDAVTRILAVKAALGLFDKPASVNGIDLGAIGSPERRGLARECVIRSMTLLKNEHKALPIKRNLKHVHIMGSAAVDLGLQCGGWTLSWQGRPGLGVPGAVGLFEALCETAGGAVLVTHSAEGPAPESAEAVVVVAAEPPYAEMKGDDPDPRISDACLDLLRSARASGKRVIGVAYCGRPIALDEAWGLADAWLIAWLPGGEAGGIADVLWGDRSPGGRLPRPWRVESRARSSAGEGAGAGLVLPLDFGLSYD